MENNSSKFEVTIGSYRADTNVVVFNFARQGRPCAAQEVTVTGNLRADLAKAARWMMPRLTGKEGGKLALKQTYCELPHAGLAAYGITRESAPLGEVSVAAPVYIVTQ